MIVWSGRGALSVLVLIASFVLFNSIIPRAYSDYAFVLSFFSAGAFSWFMGKKWNDAGPKVLIDKATGKEIQLEPNHSLFWIKMHYWGIIFGILGVVVLIQAVL